MLPDMPKLHTSRLARAREFLSREGIAAALLTNPMNIRYVSVPGPLTVNALHTTFRYVLVPVVGSPILWEYEMAIRIGVPEYWTGETRQSVEYTYFGSGSNSANDAKRFAQEITGALRDLGIEGEPLGIDRLEGVAIVALQEAGIELVDATPAMELARVVKTPEELDILRANAATCDIAIDEMLKIMKPGVTEDELWGTLVGEALKRGADWCETRLLSSGPRTNPWFQEATGRQVQNGELVAFDTDLVGQYGYLTDISRTYLCGDLPATDEQRRLFEAAYTYVRDNMDEMRAGLSFAELGEKLGPRLPVEFRDQKYGMIAHGSGQVDEYPCINWEKHHDGVLEPGMVLSVEAYAGPIGGSQGVKLEEQIIILPEGPPEVIARAPFDERLML